MEVLALIALSVFCLAGFTAIFFSSVGTLVIFAGIFLYSFLTGFDVIKVNVLILLFIFYLFGELAEYLFVIIGAKKFGASNAAAAGAVIGGIAGIIGGFFFAGAGLFLTVILGIFLGAFLAEFIGNKNFIKSVKSGAGGVIGRIGSIGVKVVVAIVMLGIVAANIAGS